MTNVRTTALCNECGEPRSVSATFRSREPADRPGEPGVRGFGAEGYDGDRLMVTLKCAACRRPTRHAKLRVGPYRDHIEEMQAAEIAQTPAALQARLELSIGQLRDLGIRIWVEDMPGAWIYEVIWYLDTGEYGIVLDEGLPPGDALEILDEVLTRYICGSGEARWQVTPADDDNPALARLGFVRR